MIEGRTILCFASGYDAPPTSKHHVMHLLAERNTVLWVNYHASRTPSASASDLRYMARKLGQVFGGLRKARENLYVLTPLVLPLPGSGRAKRLNRRLLVHQIRRALAKVRNGPVQVWSFTPDISYLLGQFGEEKVLYYCVDDFASFTGYDRGQVLRDEADLCRRADLVVTTSQALQDAKALLNPNTILVTHGVDYEHFSRAVSENLPVPEDMKAIPHPVLGFFGLIRDWVDLDLLAEVARLRPDWHIVLIGDSTVDLGPYRGIPNMHFLGRRPYADLPAYCKAFDVGLIPFKINKLTEAVNPIKLREYFAAGLPVVSTPLPAVRGYQGMLHLAEEPDAFMSAVQSALAENPGKRRTRSAAMAEETWRHKVDPIMEELPGARCPDAVSARGLGVVARTKHPKIIVSMAGGGFGFQTDSFLRQCPAGVDVVVVAANHLQSIIENYRSGWPCHDLRVRLVGRQRSRSQGSIVTGIRRYLASQVQCLHIAIQERPAAVMCIAGGISIPMLIAARFVGARTGFVDSVTRVTKPSITGRIISLLRLADRFFVQWPEAKGLYRGAEYAGRLV